MPATVYPARRGVEFADRRPYVAGDDFRYIDWSLYARRQELTVKLFTEEEANNLYFLLDASNKLVYHGRIDNNRDATRVQSNDLRDAIDATLAGKPVVKTEAAAFGCSIKRG